MQRHEVVAFAACLLALATVAYGVDHTHFDNHSKTWTIVATTSYPGGKSKFVNRQIAPGGSDVDEYNPVNHVDVTVQVLGAPFSNHFTIGSDASVVSEDTPDNQYGVDFWLNDGSGKPLKTGPFGETLSPLVTIFGPASPPAPPAASPPPASPSPTIQGQGGLYWNDVQDEGCKAPGYRQKSAHLVGSASRSNWEADCKKTPFTNGFETLNGDDTTCADKGLFSGERGTWQVFDKACLPYWGSFKDDGCKSKGFRQYSSVLYGIPSGQSWEGWCKNFPADIKGVGSNQQHFYKPDRCVTTLFNIWGEFDYPDNSCCTNSGSPGGNHDELAGAGSRKLLIFPPRCDALTGPSLPVTAAAFLLALLHSARDRAEIQLRNTAIQAIQPPASSVGRNQRTRTRFWERDVYVPGSNNRQLRDNFRVPVFQAFPVANGPVNPPDYLPDQSDAFDATWVPRFTVGAGPLNTPSFTQQNADGVIDIPATAYVTIDASGPDVLLTSQLTGCAFVWAYDAANNVFYAAHLNPDSNSRNDWARNGNDLANALTARARFHGTELTVNVYGRNGFGYTGTNGNIMAVRNRDTMQWEVIAQSLGVDRSVPTDVQTVDYDAVQPDGN